MLISLLAPLEVSKVTSGWGSSRSYRATVDNPHPTHEGLDFTASVGKRVLAMAAGTVSLAEASPTTTAGRFVRVDHGGGVVSEYLHLSSIVVKKGQRVSAHQVLGFTGTSGVNGDGSVVPHLHLTIRLSGTALSTYKSLYGTPTNGFGHTNNGGTAVPGEPLVPASYSSSVLAKSASFGVTTVRKVGSGNTLLLMAAAFGAWWLYSSSKRRS